MFHKFNHPFIDIVDFKTRKIIEKNMNTKTEHLYHFR